jgi:hypothetical protein
MVQVHPGPLQKPPRQRGFLLVRGARGTVRIELLVNVGQPPPWTETQMAKRKTVPEGRQRVVVETGIYRKSTGKYLAQYRDPGRKQHWKEFTTLDAARKWRARAIQDPTSISAGKRVPQRGVEHLPRAPRREPEADHPGQLGARVARPHRASPRATGQ